MKRLHLHCLAIGLSCTLGVLCAALPERVAASDFLAGDIKDTPYREVLVRRARRRELAQRPMWHILLHYKPRYFGGFKSEADRPGFFLADDGKTNPQAELKATIAEILAPAIKETRDKQHPQCQFPARFKWLREALDIDMRHVALQPCPRFRSWRDNLNAGGATLVYASAYINNPASMFGHTFLRLDKKGIRTPDLLAYIINYSATPTTYNPIFYTILGLAGGFDGRFATMPYYMKVQEYNSLERRDLWEYRLKLREDQVDLLVAHAWELGSTHFDYFYLDENCSYHILSLLELTDPGLRLQDRHPFLTIPVETIQSLYKYPHLILDIQFRPSLRRRMEAYEQALTDREQDLARRLARGNATDEGLKLDALPAKRQAIVLDAAFEIEAFENPQEAPEGDQGLAPNPRALELQIQRASLGIPSSPPVADPPKPPDSAHAASIIRVGIGANREGTFSELWWRIALHDLLSAPDGYNPEEQIEMLSVRLRYQHGERIDPERIDAVRIFSLAPLTAWDKRLSWHLRVGMRVPHDLGCEGWGCVYGGAEGGPGIAFRSTIFVREVYYLMSDFSADGGPGFENGYRFAAGGRFGMLLALTDFWRVLAEVGGGYQFMGSDASEATYRFRVGQNFRLERNIELRFEWRRFRNRFDDGVMMLGIYF